MAKKKVRKTSEKLSRKNIILFASAGVLVIALAVTAIFLLNGSSLGAERVISLGTVMNGVHVNGIDLSGMTRSEALEATADIPGQLLDEVSVPLDVNGTTYTYTATDLAIGTDYDEIIDQALSYGHTGPFDDRLQAANTAKEQGVELTVSLAVDESELQSALAAIKTVLDQQPQDAQAVFTPWGHYADGTPYTPDAQVLIETAANGKTITYPAELVRLTEDEMPDMLRYQYWKNTKYGDEYIPDAATISRFWYVPEQTGLTVDTASIASEIMTQAESGTFSTITVPVTVTQPTVTLDTVKGQSQLITSWTSSYSTHYSFNRNWNVAKLSGIICGVTIDPGVEWSINEEAGPRSVAGGWQLASGITDGGYVDQPGGGVCQISSTLFNAAIRAGLSTKSKHHSIVSGYMPKGLDATISTGGPDLKITNTLTSAIYIVSFMNPETKTVTVEIYGPPVIDAATGEEVIYDFESGDPTFYGDPVMQYFYNTATLPDGTAIPVGESKVYAENQRGMKVTTHRLYYKLDGTKYNEETFETVNINPINGKTYCNYPDPATVTPTPPPAESPSESPSESPVMG